MKIFPVAGENTPFGKAILNDFALPLLCSRLKIGLQASACYRYQATRTASNENQVAIAR